MSRESMEPREPADELIREFLLGRIPEAEREKVEERLLTDPAFSELVSAIEEELIDAYTAGLLQGEQRDWFETRFLVTEDRRRKVHFSRALAQLRVDQLPKAEVRPVPEASTRGARMRWGVAAAAVVLVSLGSTLWIRRTAVALRAELNEAENRVASLERDRDTLVEEHRRALAEAEERLRASSSVPTETVPYPRSVVTASPILVASLTPGAFRSGDSGTASIRPSSSVMLVELRLEMAEDTHPSYEVSVHDASGKEVLRLSGLRATATPSEVTVPARLPADYLVPGDYSVRLFGESGDEREELDRYYLRVPPR